MLTRSTFTGKPVRIEPIKAFADNYIWAIHSKDQKHLCVVDPGDSKPVLEYLASHNLVLDTILITHYHNDHIGGVEQLKQQTGCKVYASSKDKLAFTDQALLHNDNISILRSEYNFKVLQIPGHTLGHIAYYDEQNDLLFCGDTLFRAGCGRMFEGTAKQFYQSLQLLAKLPLQTKVYCTHEYTLSNLAFAQHLEPTNQAIDALIIKCKELREKQMATLPSTIASELATNPFLRCQQVELTQSIERLTGKYSDNPVQTFATIRQLKDNF